MTGTTKTPRQEKLWLDPQVGDACETVGGRRRTVTQLSYRGYGARGNDRPHPDRRPGDWLDMVVYEQSGRTRSCVGETWKTWCRQAIAAGGRYESVAR